MATDAPQPDPPSPSPPESAAVPAPFPAAWQPLTPRGTAAFAHARLGRLLLVQFLVALVIAGAVAWFLATVWFPTALAAIRQLPAAGLIAHQRLSLARDSVEPLARSPWLAFLVDLDGRTPTGVDADVRCVLRADRFALCSDLGCVEWRYPANRIIQFNRTELEPWWGAWESTLLFLAGMIVVVLLFASWFLLATLSAPAIWLLAYFKDRRLSPVGAWKFSGASLLPGALLCALGLVLYGLGVIDLIRFAILWVMHLLPGWLYLILGLRHLPSTDDSPPGPARGRANPFDATQGPASVEARN